MATAQALAAMARMPITATDACSRCTDPERDGAAQGIGNSGEGIPLSPGKLSGLSGGWESTRICPKGNPSPGDQRAEAIRHRPPHCIEVSIP